MSWQCNYCGHRTEPVKEVKEDGEDWPAGRSCSKCAVGEMVLRPTPEQPRTWFLDFDGTLVAHKSHMRDEDYILDDTKDFFTSVVKDNDYVVITTARGEDHKERVEGFLTRNNIRFDLVLCGLPTGPRILVNDSKPCGMQTAYSYNLERDKGILSVDWCNKEKK